ncbi:hypothetical protein COV24_02370 [candidate division WWE3 bacterium CG10_big_fil_rev_8_21_14_0_10_32_10]|uniref:Uncharacterized protein n=1 Tax=candidate division WWE3 bacterium CG10_big_fil_rev_8_21_14_0_10_32_10 TaxID=1975090 RepID=A0A2H0RBU8_UNCKA|nr:MAG: hypothetical protein COV24_02370 [candidate division WWE3 bacterium CG10_big_fil_rev_8_21_14_0_10_32_10]
MLKKIIENITLDLIYSKNNGDIIKEYPSSVFNYLKDTDLNSHIRQLLEFTEGNKNNDLSNSIKQFLIADFAYYLDEGYSKKTNSYLTRYTGYLFESYTKKELESKIEKCLKVLGFNNIVYYYSPISVGAKEKKKIRTSMQDRFFIFFTNPSLLGGARFLHNSNLYDYSWTNLINNSL